MTIRKRGNVRVIPGKPLEFADEEDVSAQEGASEAPKRSIGAALKAYRNAAGELLNGKYADLAPIAPAHLRERGNIFVAICRDGVFVRYDIPDANEPKTRVAEIDGGIAEIALGFSEQVLHLDVEPFQPEKAPKINLAVGRPGEELQPVLSIAVAMFASSKPSSSYREASPPARPAPLVSLTSDLTMELGGELLPAEEKTRAQSKQQQFVVRARFPLAVGWRAIEMYPLLPDECWQVGSAPLWAELDILAAAAQHNLQEKKYDALDSRAGARAQYAALLEEFKLLLDGPEEPMHQFLRNHPELIAPTSDRFWSKLRFGARVSDFVFREPQNDYELVELEAPVRELFRKDGQQREELTHAINQVADWISYIEDDRKRVEDELGLVGISTNPRSLIVIGRSDSLRPEDRRKLTTLQNQIPKLRIMTYDDLLASARATLERILGPLEFGGPNVSVYFFS
jgi:hypothetical protein